MLVLRGEEINVSALPEVIAASAHSLEIRLRGGIFLHPHIRHPSERIRRSFGRPADVVGDRVVREIFIGNAIGAVIDHCLPDFFRGGLNLGAVLVRDRLKVQRHSLIEFVQSRICPRPEEMRLALEPFVGWGVEAGLPEIGDGIIGGVDYRVAELPLECHKPVVGPFSLAVQKLDRVVVGIVVGAESQRLDSVLVESVKVFTADLRAVALLAVVERLIDSVHSFLRKFRCGPHISARNLVGRSCVEHICAGG